jgi:allene oxide cyclase
MLQFRPASLLNRSGWLIGFHESSHAEESIVSRLNHCVIAAAFGICVDGSALASEHLRFVERAVSDTTTDLGPKGDSVGDLLTFLNPVFSADDKTQVGTDQGFCIRVSVGKSWECFWTLSLKDGQVTIEGPFYDKGDSEMAVTGGTGRFKGAKGSLLLRARDAKGSEFDLIYNLL